MAGVSVSSLIPRSSSSCGIWCSRCLFSVAILFCVLLSSCEAKSLLPQSAPDNQEFKPLAEVTEGVEAKSAAAVVTSGAEENVKSGSEKLLPRNLEESSSQSNSGSLRASATESSTQRRGQWMIGLKPFYYKIVDYIYYRKSHQTQETETNDVVPRDSTNLSQPNLEESSSQSNSASLEATESSEGATTTGKWERGVRTSYHRMWNYYTYWKPYQPQATATNDVAPRDSTNLSQRASAAESSSQSNSPTQPQGRWVLTLTSYSTNAVRYIYEWTGSDDVFKGVEMKEIDLDDDDDEDDDDDDETTETDDTEEGEEEPEDETSQEIDMEGPEDGTEESEIDNAAATGEASIRGSSSGFLPYTGERRINKISSALMEKLTRNQNNDSVKPVEMDEDNGWKGALRASASVLIVLVGAFTAALALSHCWVVFKPIPSEDVTADATIPKLFFNEGSSSDASVSPYSFLSTDPTRADFSIAICETDDQMSKVNKV